MLTYSSWLKSTKDGRVVEDILHELWLKNGCAFSLVGVEDYLTIKEIKIFSHLQGVMDTFAALEAGSFPSVTGNEPPPECFKITREMVDGWSQVC